MAKKKTKVLSIKQQTSMLLTPCKTKAELNKWIKYHLDLDLPNITVSRYADSNPFEIIWELYDLMVLNNNPTNISEILCVAGRGSGKCVTQGTIVNTTNGPKKIENIAINDVIHTGKNWAKVKNTFDEGILKSVQINTNVGKRAGAFSITGSYDRHRLLYLNQDTGKIEWKYMKDMVPGDCLYKSSISDHKVNTKSEDFSDGWLVGVIAGDGCVGRQSRKENKISISGADFKQHRHMVNSIHKKFGIKGYVNRVSKKAISVTYHRKSFKEWFSSYMSGELCYFKKLKTLEHSFDFLAGFISGIMDTDGSHSSICLANPELVSQIAQILTVFGVHSVINTCRRPTSTTKFVKGHTVEYWQCNYKTKLPDYLFPLFSKRDKFTRHRNKMNEQFRYPSVPVIKFGEYIKKKYEIGCGYWKLKSGKKTHSNIKYSKDLWGSGAKSKELYVYGYKIDYFIELAKKLNESVWAEQLTLLRNGMFETVDNIKISEEYFYDLEVDDEMHSYWSNGFISHNTLGMAILELLVILHDQREAVHVGATQSQGDRCYLYVKNFLYNRKLKHLVMPYKVPEDKRILANANLMKSNFNIKGERVTLEVLPCTLKALNGPHVPLVVVDEIDTVSGEGLKAFKEISGMLDSKNGKKSMRIGISTRKSRYGLMNQQIETAEEQDREVRRWTGFEFTERCPDSRSGTDPTDLYILQEDMIVAVEEEWKLKDKKKQKEYVKYAMPGSGCVTCPLASICLGDAKNQTCKSKMLKPIDDMAKKVLKEGADWALAQLMNLKPSVEGIVYKEFDERIHVKDWNFLWKKLTGKDYPNNECDHDVFVRKCHELGLPCYAGIDWGWNSPNTVVYFFVDPHENIYVVRTDGMTQMSEPAWIHRLKTKWHHIYRCQLYFPDQANQGAIEELKKAGLPASNDKKKLDIMTGVQVVKKQLRIPGGIDTKLFIAKETCQHIIDEFLMYHFKLDAAGQVTEDAAKEYDHWLDAIRYALLGLFGSSTMIMSGGTDEDSLASIVDKKGSYFRTPSPGEFAKAKNIVFNEEIDTSKVGKIGKLSDLQDDDDDEIGGDGGFLWSFN